MTKGILDRSFKYVPASHTDIRKTFTKVRRELAREKLQTQGNGLEQQRNVTSLGPRC
jgi:hypothetical protein